MTRAFYRTPEQTYERLLETTLEDCVGTLSGQEQNFARSLLDALRKYGRLSGAQIRAVKPLSDRAYGILEDCDPFIIQLSGDFKLFDIFTRAARTVRPNVLLRLENTDVQLTLHDNGEFIGISTPGGASYQQGAYFGQISPTGRMTLSRKVILPDGLRPTLTRFAQNPFPMMQNYGKLTGRCCVCHKPLQDPKSIEIGIGPVCRKAFAAI